MKKDKDLADAVEAFCGYPPRKNVKEIAGCIVGGMLFLSLLGGLVAFGFLFLMG